MSFRVRTTLSRALLIALLTTTGGAALAQTPPLPAAAIEVRQVMSGGDLDRSIELAEAWAGREPQNSQAFLWLGRVYGRQALEASMFTKLSWAGKCREAWENAVKLDGSNIDAHFDLLSYYLQAPGIAGGGRDKAEAALTAIDALHASYGELARGQIAASDKDLATAQRHFEAAVAADTSSIRARTALANLHLREQRNSDARAVWQQVLQADPANVYAIYQLGRLAALTGEELEQGLSQIDQFLAVADKPSDLSVEGAHWRRGQILAKLGRKDEARAALQLASAGDKQVAELAKADLQKL
jgi:tetratricopeptide (TPR) repeat protein